MIKASPSLWKVSFWSSGWLLPWDTKLSLLPPLLVPSYMDFWETHLHPILMFHPSWEVAVTAQPGKKLILLGLLVTLLNCFAARGLFSRCLCISLLFFLLILVPSLNSDGNVT